MSQYIHPDGDLGWFRGGQKLDNTQSKYSIGYRNGNKLAQYGGSNVTSSRVSVLTISQLTSSDSGVYTCRLSGTDQSGDFNLTVLGKWSFGVCEVLCTRIAHRYMANFKMSIYSFHYWNKNVHKCAVAGGEGRGVGGEWEGEGVVICHFLVHKLCG